jgi:hypothetical protein
MAVLRGFVFIYYARIIVKVRPTCSQWNAPQAAESGFCGRRAYIPPRDDVEPVADIARIESVIFLDGSDPFPEGTG